MGRRYRRRSPSSSIISDSLFIFSRARWHTAFLLTILFSTLFLLVIPWWLTGKAEANAGNQFHGAITVILAKRAHWSQWIGTVILIIGCYFTVRNYFVQEHADKYEKGIVGFLARFFGRD